jgi:hypothetical protein
MRHRLKIWGFGVWLVVLEGTLHAGQFQLGAIFTDGMVLQRSDQTLLWGSGTPGERVWVRFNGRGKTWLGTNDNSGMWQVQVSITNVGSYPSPCSIVLGEGKRNRPGVELKHVILGDVWVVGVRPEQGISARVGTIEMLHADSIRVLDLTQVRSASTTAPAPVQPWSPCPTGREMEAFPALTLCMAEFLAASREVGIVQVPAAVLDRGLIPATRSPSNIPPSITNAWSRANSEVARQRSDRWERLIAAKRQGMVTNLPPLIDYSPISVHTSQAFSPAQPPALWLTFRGAIWPQQAPAGPKH